MRLGRLTWKSTKGIWIWQRTCVNHWPCDDIVVQRSWPITLTRGKELSSPVLEASSKSLLWRSSTLRNKLFTSSPLGILVDLHSSSCVPLPVPDKNHPCTGCDQCNGPCFGHYLVQLSPLQFPQVPTWKVSLTSYCTIHPHKLCVKTSQSMLLSPEQVSMWFEHLHAYCMWESKARSSLYS